MRPVRILEKSCPGWEKWWCVGQWTSGYYPHPCFRTKALSLSAAGAHSCIPLQESHQTGLCPLPAGSPHQWLMVPAPPSCFRLGKLWRAVPAPEVSLGSARVPGVPAHCSASPSAPFCFLLFLAGISQCSPHTPSQTNPAQSQHPAQRLICHRFKSGLWKHF